MTDEQFEKAKILKLEISELKHLAFLFGFANYSSDMRVGKGWKLSKKKRIKLYSVSGNCKEHIEEVRLPKELCEEFANILNKLMLEKQKELREL